MKCFSSYVWLSQAIYFQEVDASRLSLDTLLEVVTLCDKYLDQRLLNDCIDSISKIITEENCREIYEFILPMLKCQRLADRAFEVLIRLVEFFACSDVVN